MNMGEKILRLRRARGWSQEELAEQLNVTRQAISRWESESSKPDADKITALCGIFGVSADYLLCTGTAVNASPMNQQTQLPQSADKSILHRMIIGITFISLSLVLFLVLVYLSEANPCSYTDLSGTYEGVLGYVLVRDLQWFVVVILLMFMFGIMMLLWKYLRNACAWIFGRIKN